MGASIFNAETMLLKHDAKRRYKCFNPTLKCNAKLQRRNATQNCNAEMQCRIATLKSNAEKQRKIAAPSRREICLGLTSFVLDCTHVTGARSVH